MHSKCKANDNGQIDKQLYFRITTNVWIGHDLHKFFFTKLHEFTILIKIIPNLSDYRKNDLQ